MTTLRGVTKVSLEKHSLLKEFPDHHHTIRHLKMHDAHFSKLFDEYHDLDHEIYSLESGKIVSSEDHLEAQKMRRVELKDILYKMVIKEEQSQ